MGGGQYCPPGRKSPVIGKKTPTFKTSYGKRIFAYYGPRLWNALPVDIRAVQDVETYKKKLKTLLFEGHDDLVKRAFKYNS